MYRKVLVPLDGSELAECALSHVKDLVKDGAVGEVIVLNVFHIHIHHGGEMGIYLESKMMREGMLEEYRQYLASVQSRLASEGIEVKTESLEGNDPADTVSEYAQDNGVDLIVIASHGYTGLKKLMLGSVALGILHESHIPVLLIRPESCRR
ncbi:MAG: universal stress protein [Deltaproteobacteria bacterium]|nr:universal stress protein [Deltaproteobacteria bacterium]